MRPRNFLIARPARLKKWGETGSVVWLTAGLRQLDFPSREERSLFALARPGASQEQHLRGSGANYIDNPGRLVIVKEQIPCKLRVNSSSAPRGHNLPARGVLGSSRFPARPPFENTNPSVYLRATGSRAGAGEALATA